MQHLFAAIGLGAIAIILPPSSRGTAAPIDGIAQSTILDSDLSYAKYKGAKGKAMKRRGPPRWAPAHGLRRKRGY
jgi:hypothetical protein